jgi:uncharacterized phage protein (TIGR01671 family)
MRNIKFRAQDFNGNWRYGFVAKVNESFVIIPQEKEDAVAIYVIPETICQYTELNDVLQNEVYEGDIVIMDGEPNNRRIVVYYEEAFNIATTTEYEDLKKGSHPYLNDYAHMTCLNEWSNTGLVRVIGNIFDDPELLEK